MTLNLVIESFSKRILFLNVTFFFFIVVIFFLHGLFMKTRKGYKRSMDKLILKSPITTPQGKGYKRLNITLRKSLGLFSKVRPVRAYSPYVQMNFAGMDVVIVRENEEDLYARIEHQQTKHVVLCFKLIS